MTRQERIEEIIKLKCNNLWQCSRNTKITPYKITNLAQAIDRLVSELIEKEVQEYKEKAWKYDELCK